MSDMKDKKGECCKGFEDSACPCLDEETGERSCGTEKPSNDDKVPENDSGCGNCGCTPKAP